MKRRQQGEFVTQEGDMIYVQNLRVLDSHFLKITVSEMELLKKNKHTKG